MDYVLHFARNQDLILVLFFLARPPRVHTMRELEPADISVEDARRVEVQIFLFAWVQNYHFSGLCDHGAVVLALRFSNSQGFLDISFCLARIWFLGWLLLIIWYIWYFFGFLFCWQFV